MNNEKPDWFCGDARDWSVFSPKVRAQRVRGALNKKSSAVTELALWVGAFSASSIVLGGNPPATASNLFLLFTPIICSAASLLSLFVSQTCDGTIMTTPKPSHLLTYVGDIIHMARRRNLDDRDKLLAMERSAQAAVWEGRDSDGNLTDEGRAAELVAQTAARRVRELDKERLDNERVPTEKARMAEAARRAVPEAFSKQADDAWKPSTLEARLAGMEEMGADGSAAVSLARAMLKENKVDAVERSELTRMMEVNLPKLLDSWEAVPYEDREMVHDALGDTPNRALARGLEAAFKRVMEIRAALSARSRTEVEAEARVLESKTKTL